MPLKTEKAIAVALMLTGLLPGCGNVKRFLYEGFGRDGWQHPEKVVEALAIQPGARIADLGAGGGYFTFRLADATGPTGKVYAVDVDRDMTDYLEERTREGGYAAIDVVLAKPDDMLLPDAVDLIFTCNTYHHIEDRPSYFAHAARYLRSGGRIAVVEYESKGWFQKLFGHSTAPEVIRDEMTAAGYRLVESHGFLPRQSFQIFAKDEPVG